ncbi:choice-of-anchor D domain-containing protein [bacterium]|nr:choice-of-anchor D domain-containing protein [bacterium]
MMRRTLAYSVLLLLVTGWSFPELVSQVHDQSDAVFSIVMPSSEARDVDMGIVFAGSEKDSLLRRFVENTGRTAIRIDTIIIEGGQAGSFSVTGGIPPVRVGEGEGHDVVFAFHPAVEGDFSADIVLYTQVDTQRYRIHGRAVAQRVTVVTGPVDFGAIPVGAVRDSLVDVVLRNLSPLPVELQHIVQAGPDSAQFVMLDGAEPFMLPPWSTHAMTLRFAPKRAGRTSGSVHFHAAGLPLPVTMQLFGEGIGVQAAAVLATDTVRAAAGTMITLPIRLRDMQDFQLSGATSVFTQLRYRASLLVPVGATPEGQLIGKDRVIPLDDLPTLPLRDDIIAEFTFLVVLGDTTGTTLQLEHSAAKGGDVALSEENGLLLLTDLCEEGGTRLFDGDARVALQPNSPNPFNGVTAIRFQVIERAHALLSVRDVSGRVVETLFDAEAEPGQYVVTFDAAALSSGSYIIELRSGVTLQRQVMTVLK